MREEKKRYDVIHEQLVTRHQTTRTGIESIRCSISCCLYLMCVVVAVLVPTESIEGPMKSRCDEDRL